MAVDLQEDKDGNRIQVFPLTPGKINITTGTIEDCVLLCCVVDGSITLVTTAQTIACVSGDVFACPRQSLTVVSGTFHLA